MKKITYLLLSLLLLGITAPASNPVKAVKTVPLPDLIKPKSIHIDTHRIYVLEEASVYIYRIKDFSLEKKFGKKGEGPQEFKTDPSFSIRVAVMKDKLIIYSKGKISFFKKNGAFIEERKCLATSPVYILGENYVILDKLPNEKKRDYIAYYMCNSRYEKLKELGRMLFPIDFGKKWLFYHQFGFPRFYENKIFLTNGTGLSIYGFNGNGENILSLESDYDRVKLTKQTIKATHDWFKTRHVNKLFYDDFKSWFRFPEYFPAIKDFKIADDKIYIQTYRKRRKAESEFLIFTIKGQFVKKLYLPLIEENIQKTYPYTFKDGKLFQLIEDIDREEWGLKIAPL